MPPQNFPKVLEGGPPPIVREMIELRQSKIVNSVSQEMRRGWCWVGLWVAKLPALPGMSLLTVWACLKHYILRAPPLPPTLWWGRCPLGADMTLWEDILEGQNWGPWAFSRPGTFKKRVPVKNDVEWYPQE